MEFLPKTFSFTVTTEDELKELWCRFDLSTNSILDDMRGYDLEMICNMVDFKEATFPSLSYRIFTELDTYAHKMGLL